VAAPRQASRPTTSRAVTDEELAKLGEGYEQARELFDRLATGDEFVEFLTLPAYDAAGLSAPAAPPPPRRSTAPAVGTNERHASWPRWLDTAAAFSRRMCQMSWAAIGHDLR
jgi:hypothetical protein